MHSRWITRIPLRQGYGGQVKRVMTGRWFVFLVIHHEAHEKARKGFGEEFRGLRALRGKTFLKHDDRAFRG